MEIIPVILFLVFVAIVFSNIVGFFRAHGSWTKSFEKVATRYGGWFSAAKLTRPPAATFTYKDVQVRVKCRRNKRRKGAAETEFRIFWPENRQLKMEIVPVGIAPSTRALRSTSPTQVGDEQFDSEWKAHFNGKQAHLGIRLVSSGVRWQLTQLKNAKPTSDVTISTERGWLIIRKRCFIKQEQQLDDFVRYGLELYDQMMLTQTEGIEFREDMIVSAVNEARCPICGSDIEGKMVICVRCKTPHCLDCWQYNVKCGMYACDETRYAIVGGEY